MEDNLHEGLRRSRVEVGPTSMEAEDEALSPVTAGASGSGTQPAQPVQSAKRSRDADADEEEAVRPTHFQTIENDGDSSATIDLHQDNEWMDPTLMQALQTLQERGEIPIRSSTLVANLGGNQCRAQLSGSVAVRPRGVCQGSLLTNEC